VPESIEGTPSVFESKLQERAQEQFFLHQCYQPSLKRGLFHKGTIQATLLTVVVCVHQRHTLQLKEDYKK
jgi:hypothetical protein